MRPLSEVAGEELLWVQPAARKRVHELRASDEVVATLSFQRGSLADAIAADGHWTFKRQGFWHPRVTARVAGSETDLAQFRPHWMGGGTLESPDGRTTRLTSANLWQTEWVWQESDLALIRFKGRHGMLKANGSVAIVPEALSRPDLALLVLLGWYLILLYAEDAAAASAGATVAVVASS